MKAISFLGPTDYKTVTYTYRDQEFTTRLFPEALFHFFPDLQQLYVFATPTVQSHPNLAQLRERVPPDRLTVVPIPEGHTEEELWDIFSALTEVVAEREEVVFDITHSFRSIPFLTFLAAAYLRAARRARIRAVVYGAYDARPKDDPGPRPVFDLTPFVSLLDWLAATNQFIHTGDAQYLARLLRQEGAARRSGALKHAGETLEPFSLAVMLCRPLEVMRDAGRMENMLKRAAGVMAQWARPFTVMADRIQAEYGKYNLPDPIGDVAASLRHQLSIIRWYAEHGQIIQAVTLAREWVVTAVGMQLQGSFILATDEREKIERGLSGLCRVAQGRSFPYELNEVGRALQSWPEAQAIRDLWNQLSTVRNDLDHAGMNLGPMKAATLRRTTQEEILPALEALARQWGLAEESP
jgi:CRISPR-associated protein, TM1812 family